MDENKTSNKEIVIEHLDGPKKPKYDENKSYYSEPKTSQVPYAYRDRTNFWKVPGI